MLLKRRFLCPLGVSPTCNHAETPGGQPIVVKIASYKKYIYIMIISTIYECVKKTRSL